MSLSFRLPRRTPKPGRHTIAAVRSRLADSAANEGSARVPMPLGMPGPDATMYLPASETHKEAQR